MASTVSSCCYSANLSTTHRHFPRLRRTVVAFGPGFAVAAPPADPTSIVLSSSSSLPSSSVKIGLFSSAISTAPVIHFGPTRLSDKEVPLSKRLVSLIVGSSGNSDVGLGSSDGGDGVGGGSGSGGGGGGEGEGQGGEDSSSEKNRLEALLALSQAGRSLGSIPNDLAAAIQAGRIPGSIVNRFFELEKSPLLGWLLQFGGFKERLLADDLFLTKVAIECGVGIFTKVSPQFFLFFSTLFVH